MNNIVDRISKICDNQKILNHIKRLIKDYDIVEFDDNFIKGKKYVDYFEINISDNGFTIYSTSWSNSSKWKIIFIEHGNEKILTFTNKEECDTGYINIVNKYIFEDNKLKRYSYCKKVDLKFKIEEKYKNIISDLIISIYPLGEKDAIKVVNKDGFNKYYYTQINQVGFSDIGLFSGLNSKMDEETNYESMRKVLKRSY